MYTIDIKRKKGESFDAMFRRFSKRVQQSGKVLNVRSGRFFAKTPTKNKRKESKLRGQVIGAKRQYLIRTGKMSPADFKPKHRR